MRTHSRDTDCTLDPRTDTCTDCGVYHGEPCPDCGGRGFHAARCIESAEDALLRIGDAIVVAMDAGLDREALRMEYGAAQDRIDAMREPFRIAARASRLAWMRAKGME